MAEARDPIADLEAELAREAEATAAGKGKPAPAPAEDDEDVVEEVAAADDPEAVADSDDKAQAAIEGKAKPRSEAVPRARLDESEGRRRRLAKESAEKDARIAELEAKLTPSKKPAPGEVDVDKLREDIRNEERFKLRVDQFSDAGHETYGEEAFDEACERLNELGAPGSILTIALEATDTPGQAAKSLFVFGQQPPAEIERVLKLSPLKQGAYLARLSTQRAKAETPADDPPARSATKKTPPKPLGAIKGNAAMADGFGDDVPDDVWGKRFDEQVLGIRTAH